MVRTQAPFIKFYVAWLNLFKFPHNGKEKRERQQRQTAVSTGAKKKKKRQTGRQIKITPAIEHNINP